MWLILTRNAQGGIITNGGISEAKKRWEKMAGKNGAWSTDTQGARVAVFIH